MPPITGGDASATPQAFHVNRVNRLSLLVDLSSLLTREVYFDALLKTACERVAEALAAERATIWLVDAEHGDLVSRVALLPELPALRLPLERGIAGWVARTGESVRIADAATDSRFDPSVDKATGYTTRAILAVPIREEAGGPVRGVVQVLNRAASAEGGAASFDAEDEKYLVALATQDLAGVTASVTSPSGKTSRLDLAPAQPGLWQADLDAAEPGVWQVADGEHTIYVAASNANPREIADLRATATVLSPIARASGGSVRFVGASPSDLHLPDLRRTEPGREAAGSGWIGLPRRNDHIVTGQRYRWVEGAADPTAIRKNAGRRQRSAVMTRNLMPVC